MVPTGTPHLPRATIVAVAALALTTYAAFALIEREIARERRALIEHKLEGAAEILAQPASDALSGSASREAFLDRLRDLASMTGLRITLIGASGDVLADSEVRGAMPNLSDRPEVRAASAAGYASAARKSSVTGKETVYVARAVESDGRTLGTIRAAIEASEIDTVLVGLERIFAAIASAMLGIGVLIGRALRGRDAEHADVVVLADEAHPTRAIEPTLDIADAPSLVRAATATRAEPHTLTRGD